MIAKTIHFFHNKDFVENIIKYDNVSNRCFATWKHYLPGYELRLWHDELPEFQEMLMASAYLREMYQKKIWAVVSDYVRAWVVCRYGGIYMDTDVYLFQNVDHLLDNQFFTFSMPVDNNDELAWHVEPAFFGAIPGHPVLLEVLKIYDTDEIFKMPIWLANDVFSLAILRAKKDFSDGIITPANLAEYESGQRGDLLSQNLIQGKASIMQKEGITLYPRHMLGEGGAVGKLKDRWFLISPPPLPSKMKHNSDIFSLQDVVAYHICGNSWKGDVPYLETKNLKGMHRIKSIMTHKIKNLGARIKQIVRTKIKNM